MLPSARELDPGEIELMEIARRALDAATEGAPYEDGVYTMGAAVRSADGAVYAGVNLYHFTGGPCAELVALGAARAQGARRITHIVAMGRGELAPARPCGRDRQVLIDYYPGIRVIVPTPDGVRSVGIEDLIPLASPPRPWWERAMTQTISFSPDFLEVIRSGKKTRTTRFEDPATMGPAMLEFEREGEPVRLRAIVTGLRDTTFAALTDDDARHEAMESADQLRAVLRTFYPAIAAGDPVQVVSFRLV